MQTLYEEECASRSLRFLASMHLNISPKVLFTISVWPLIWGWQVIQKRNLVLSFPHKVL